MPSNYEAAKSISRVAGEDLTDGQYLFVKVDGNGHVVHAGNGDRAIGVTSGKAGLGQAITVDIDGRTLVRAGAAIAAGAIVQSNANGEAITQASTGDVCGTALEAAAAQGDLVSILFDAQGAP